MTETNGKYTYLSDGTTQADHTEKVKVVVEVDELEGKQSSSNNSTGIKEKVYELFTGNNKQIEFTTDHINGLLEGIILSTTKGIQAEIFIDGGATDIVLYEDVDFKGTKYLPLRAMAVPSRGGEQFNFSPVQWALNDFLKIKIKGVENTSIILTVRYS